MTKEFMTNSNKVKEECISVQSSLTFDFAISPGMTLIGRWDLSP